MFRRFGINFAILSMVLDGLLTFLALLCAVWLRPFLLQLPLLVALNDVELPLALYIIIPVLWVIVFLGASVYDSKRTYKVVDELQHVTLASAFAALVVAGLLYLAFRDVSRWLFITFVVINAAALLGWRIATRLLYKMGRVRDVEQRVLIVGAGEVGQRVGKMIETYTLTGLRLVGYLDDDTGKQADDLSILGEIQDACQVVQQNRIDDVVIALPRRAYGQVNKLVLELSQAPVRLRVVPDYFSLTLYRATVDDFGGIPMINLRDPALNDFQRLIKRLFDLTIGGVMTLLLLPVMGLIALLVRLDSVGPVIFRQERVGENGRLFAMYKFRTMVDGAEAMQTAVNQTNGNGQMIHKQPNDPRVTRVGRFLRQSSLDELPQLVNVLKGEMSLVGPRPEMPWMLTEYEPWQHKRFAVPQGMTGWWQVNGRANKPMHLHSEDDIYYVQNYSLWMDFYILFKTPWVVLRGKGAF
ncbi:MAG: sugar transferase [Chloroflexi bacterium]|nr:sugar transferase [Chloroflexota bacterium]